MPLNETACTSSNFKLVSPILNVSVTAGVNPALVIVKECTL
jgi:hypothetical protein